MRRRALTPVLLAAALLAGCGGDTDAPAPALTAAAATEPPLPAPDRPIPARPRALAARLDATTGRALDAAGAWDGRGTPPEALTLLALDHQRAIRSLARHPDRLGTTLRALPPERRALTEDLVRALRELGQIKSVVVGPPPTLEVGDPLPPATLLAHYRRATRRFDVGWPLLASVNFVETAFGRLRNRSVSGARGPMQFIPSTWAAFGLGGDIEDPRDAILGAANYLSANGAPTDEANALFRYNPSARYVSAVSRIARQVRADRRTYHLLHAWQAYAGGRRLTGPGATPRR